MPRPGRVGGKERRDEQYTGEISMEAPPGEVASGQVTQVAVGHVLARMGARLLLSPSAWAVDADHDDEEPYGGLWLDSYTELARLYDLTVVGVSNVGWLTAGPWRGRKCIGCSLAVGPGGVILAEGPYGEDAEALIVVPIERGARRR